MHNMTKVKSKSMKPIIQATFPKYRKRTVNVEVTDKVTFYDVNWTGGTKSEYHACTISGEPLENRVNMGILPPWQNPYEGLEIEIPPGMVVVEGGWFCGKERNLYIYINPADQKLLGGN